MLLKRQVCKTKSMNLCKRMDSHINIRTKILTKIPANQIQQFKNCLICTVYFKNT